MSVIDIIKTDITTLDMDVIVNPTNRRLREGSGGVCAAIFQKAGTEEMTKACMEIGRCKTGSAVITPGFSLPAAFVIHAVGPKWEGGGHREQELLYTTYMHALTLAKENDLHSIGFPLISSGFYKFPVEEAWQCALQACHDFLQDNADYGTKIAFAIPEEKTFSLGKRMLKGFTQEERLPENVRLWCRKYAVLFHAIYEDEELQKAFYTYNAYQPQTRFTGVCRILKDCMKEAYNSGVVIPDYDTIIKDGDFSQNDLFYPSKEWIATLSHRQILAVIAWHFRRDHFNEGFWISETVAKGYMAALADALVD